jgi:hypothetical protein
MNKRMFVALLLAAGSMAPTRCLACGGGWAPFVPQSSSGDTQSRKSDLTTVDKGVSYDLFNDKELQPIIRDIQLRGNVRKNRRRGAKRKESADTTQPVLNIQRLH